MLKCRQLSTFDPFFTPMSHKPLLNFDEALALRQQIDALIEELGQAEYAAALALGEATAARQGNFPTEDEARWKEKIRAIGSARDSLRAGRLVVMDPALSRLTAGQLMHVRHYRPWGVTS